MFIVMFYTFSIIAITILLTRSYLNAEIKLLKGQLSREKDHVKVLEKALNHWREKYAKLFDNTRNHLRNDDGDSSPKRKDPTQKVHKRKQNREGK